MCRTNDTQHIHTVQHCTMIVLYRRYFSCQSDPVDNAGAVCADHTMFRSFLPAAVHAFFLLNSLKCTVNCPLSISYTARRGGVCAAPTGSIQTNLFKTAGGPILLKNERSPIRKNTPSIINIQPPIIRMVGRNFSTFFSRSAA